MKKSLSNKIKIRKLEKSFVRDRWGNLTNCRWNAFMKSDILNLDENYDNRKRTI